MKSNSEMGRPPVRRGCRILGALLIVGSSAARASDGLIEINQAKVLAAGGFPFKITKAGSYRLTSNLDVTVAADPKNTDAIDVNTNNVTIDLNGFSILGPAVCTGFPVKTSCANSGAGSGVSTSSSAISWVVRNGFIRGMGQSGVNALTGADGVVEHVTASGNGAVGIRVTQGVVRSCTAWQNGGNGIEVTDGAALDNTSSHNGGGYGIRVDTGVASRNFAFDNGGAGIGTGGLASNNMSDSNLSWGLQGFTTGAGYVGNVLTNNNGTPGNANFGGVGLNLGQNQCGAVLCP
ncbi:MAG: right-handed parallel beta-helix repeat-containing protein [Thermoanaerobaculia bacterium]